MRIKLLLLILLLSLNGFGYGYYYGQNKVNAKNIKWSKLETKHYDIYYTKGNDEFGRLAALMAEEAYYYLKQDFKLPMTSRVSIVFYGSQAEFETTNIIYPLLSEGVGGFTESLKNRVAVPFDGSYKKLEEVLTHELTHAYINALDQANPGSYFYQKVSTFPFWFSEGLPEFEAIGGQSVSNNMYVMDMVLNDGFNRLENISGYYAYRMGESFLSYIAKVYGRSKVMEYFYALRSINNLNDASKKVFGLEFNDLESRWRTDLKRQYYPFVTRYQNPAEKYELRTKHKDDGSYFNFSPRFSPNGQRYVYYSNQGARYSIWLATLHGLSPNKKILTGEATDKFEEFHYFHSNIAWFPDNKHIAFSAKTSSGDKIYIYDVDQEKLVNTINLPELTSIYELDVSPDSIHIVLSAQKNMQADLFMYNLQTGVLSQVTNDKFPDFQPRFSPKGDKIAFSSERENRSESHRKGFFSSYVSNIYVQNLETNTIVNITHSPYNCYSPVWDSLGQKILFLSERDSVTNIEMVDLKKQEKAFITQILSGIAGFDLSPNNKYLVLSNLYDGGWDIFMATSPLKDLNVEPSSIIETLPASDLTDRIDLTRLDYFGRNYRKHDSIKRIERPSPFFNSITPSDSDSLITAMNKGFDAYPDSISVIPQVKPYRTRFTLDRFWGGLAYASGVGTIGQVELGLSDLMGNHGIGISLGISGKIKDSNILMTYLYLARRTDYGVGAYNIFDEYYYRQVVENADDIYYRERIRETGLYFLVRYPFSRFLRIDFENQVYNWEYHWDRWNDSRTDWDNDFDPNIPKKTDFVDVPSISIVHDNTLYGSTGPLIGWRGYYTIRKGIAKKSNDFITNYADVRSYLFFNKRYSFATRLVGGISSGAESESFQLNGFYGIRGYSGDENGDRIVMATAELRFPFFDYITMSFPLPITIGGIRGSMFADIGSVWHESDGFRGVKDGRLDDLVLGYGFGPRINLGIFILKFDIAWISDLREISKPSYYLSLGEDF